MARRSAAIAMVVAALAAAMFLLLAGNQLRRDTSALVTVDRPPSRDELALGMVLVAMAAATDSHLVAVGRQELPAWIDGCKRWGSGKTATVIGASLVVNGLARGERRVLIGGLTLLEGNLLLGAVVDASKEACGRVRPNHPGAGAWLAGGDSFPSSHAAHAFLIASVIDETFQKPEWRWVIYAMATGVALQRVHEGVHYPTDVLAGGMLGWWVGHRLSVVHGLVERPREAAAWLAPRPSDRWLVAYASF